jgi:ubiquinone/menaquinone biosynthesis C-methylase UbiE
VKNIQSDPVQAEYSRLAGQYDNRWSFYVNATIQETLNRLEIKTGESILDLGCGTGALIQRLLQVVPKSDIAGIDPCFEMLEIARQKLPSTVALMLGSADAVPFADESFDIVVSTSAFHYFRDPAKVL